MLEPVSDPVPEPEPVPDPDAEPVADPAPEPPEPPEEPGPPVVDPVEEPDPAPGPDPQPGPEPESEPKPDAADELPPRAKGAVLRIGQRVASGGSLRSANGKHRLHVRPDGRVVIVSHGRLRWKSASGRHPGAYLILSSTGLLLVHGDHRVRVARASGVGNARITRNGDLVLRSKSGGVRWAASSAAPVRLNNRGPQYVSQDRGKYAGYRIGSATIAATGCVPTAMTMALRGYGVGVDVREVGRVMHRDGDFNRGVAGAGSVSIVAAARRYGIAAAPLKSRESIVRALKHRRTVIALLAGPETVTSPGSTHAVALHGYARGTTRMYNPYSGAPQRRYSVSTLWNHRSFDRMDRRAGAVFWAIG